MTPAPTLRVKEIAARLRVDVGRVLEWIKSGRLRAIDVSEGAGKRHRWRITPEALAAFEQSRASTQPTKAIRRRSKTGWKFQYF